MGDKNQKPALLPSLIEGMEELEKSIYISMLQGKGFRESIGVVGTQNRKLVDDIFIHRKIIGLHLARQIELGHRKISGIGSGIHQIKDESEFFDIKKAQIIRLQQLLCLFSLMRLYVSYYQKDIVFHLIECGFTHRQLEGYWEKAMERTHANKKLPPPT